MNAKQRHHAWTSIVVLAASLQLRGIVAASASRPLETPISPWPSTAPRRSSSFAFSSVSRHYGSRPSGSRARTRLPLPLPRPTSRKALGPIRVDDRDGALSSFFVLFGSGEEGDDGNGGDTTAREEDAPVNHRDDGTIQSVGCEPEKTETTATADDDGKHRIRRSEEGEPLLTPPPFLAMGYDVAAFLNAMSGLFLICAYDVRGGASVVTTASSLPLSTAAVVGTTTRYRPDALATHVAGSLGHLLLAAGSCRMLSKFARAKRLHASDTCKRLTLGTLLFGTLGLASLPGEAACCISSPPLARVAALLLTQLAKFVTASVSFVGWEYGAGGFGSGIGSRRRVRNILGEIGRGCVRLRRTMPVSDERPATFYRTFFIFATLGNLAFNVPELAHILRQGGGLFSLGTSLTVSSIARLCLMSVLLYVLKDAAERKQFESKTFVKLNFMVGLWALGVGVAQGFADGPTTLFNIRRAADKLLFSILFLNNGILSLLSKVGIIKRRDEEDADPPFRVNLF